MWPCPLTSILQILIDDSSRLKTIKGEFDLIFFDADKLNQEGYLDYILTQRLLSPKGIILVDNSKYPFSSAPALLLSARCLQS